MSAIRKHPEPATTFTGTNPSAHQSAAFSPDDHTLATINSNSTIRLWDITDPDNPRELATLTGSPDVLTSLVFSIDGHTLADLSSAGTMRLQNVSNYVLPVRAEGLVGSVAVSPDGRVLAVGHDGMVDLLDITDPARRRLLTSFIVADTHAFVTSVKFGPGGHTLAVDSAGNDGLALTLWDVTDARHPRALTTPVSSTIVAYSLDFSPDWRMLAAGNDADGTIRLWDIVNPRRPRELVSLAVPRVVFRALALAPDGRTLAAAGSDGVIRF
jgi:WD40 repeat protein